LKKSLKIRSKKKRKKLSIIGRKRGLELKKEDGVNFTF